MSVEVEGSSAPQRQWLLDGVVWALLLLSLLPAILAMESFPWAAALPAWVFPAACGCGVVAGIVLLLATIPRRWWWIPLVTTIVIGLAAIAGGLIATRSATSSTVQPVSVLLAAEAAAFGATVPWLVFRARQTWLAVLLVWFVVASAWRTALSAQEIWWIVALLACSLSLIGMEHLREQQKTWNQLGLQRIGPVLWPSARTVVTVSLLVALTGLVPLGAVRLAALAQLFSRTQLSEASSLSYTSPGGTPVALLGAPLSLRAPDTASNKIIVTYDILRGPGVAPPLLGATFTSFDGTTWTQGQTSTRQVSPQPAPAGNSSLGLPPDATGPASPDVNSSPQQIQAKITVYGLPRTSGNPILLGFAQPTGFSLTGVQARVSGTDAASPFTIMQWEKPGGVAQGATYSTSGLILPPDTTGSGSLPVSMQSKLTAIPDNLTARLRPLAEQWTAGAGSDPASRAAALLDAMQANLKLDPAAVPPDGADGVEWFLSQKRGNVLMWTTTYILLARSIGLPMRLAEGYLPGQYDAHLKTNVVRASDASVWAQLAIPGKGWLSLYPGFSVVTLTVPKQIVYLNDVTPTPQTQPTPTPKTSSSAFHPQPDAGARANGAAITTSLLITLAVLLLIALVLMVANYRWRMFGAHLAPLTRFFARVAVVARLAGIHLRPSDTATQATAKVGASVPEHSQALAQLNGMYEQFRYGPPSQEGIIPNLREQWQRVGGALWRLVVAHPWRGIAQSALSRRKDTVS